jgi:DNA-binding NarL/FixJ family response regulator
MPRSGPGNATRTASGRVDADPQLPPPDGLSARTVVLGDDEYLVLCLPVPVWNIPEHLTEAERCVTRAILRGDTNEQVASERGVSVHTVCNQIARVFEKLGVASRIELAHRLASKSPTSR